MLMFNIHRHLFFSPDETEGSTLEIPEPKTRTEKFLAKMAGAEIDIEPMTRTEKFLAKMAGDEIVIEPKTRREKFMNAIRIDDEGSSEGGTDPAYGGIQFTIDITPQDQWTDYGPAWGYKNMPVGVASYYDQSGKRQSGSFPCTAYLQPVNSYSTTEGFVAVLYRSGSLTTSGITVTPSRGTVTLVQVTGNTIAIYWSGTKAGDPVNILISEAQANAS